MTKPWPIGDNDKPVLWDDEQDRDVDYGDGTRVGLGIVLWGIIYVIALVVGLSLILTLLWR